MAFDIIKNSLLHIWPSLVIVSVAIISIRIVYIIKNQKKVHFYRDFWYFIAIIYMILLYGLVTNVDASYKSGINLTPFLEISRYKFDSELFYYNIIGNVILFIPFGFIIATFIKSKNVFSNIIICVIVSLTIELVQLKIGRSFDVDDIILNTFGSMIGFYIYSICKKIFYHLPHFLKSDWFNNLICIIITSCIVIYIMKFWSILL